MFSAKMKARMAGMALIGAAFAASATAMAGVVVKSSGPSASEYPVGTKLDDDSSITLQAGDTVTVLTSQGTRVMRGAGTFRVGERPRVTTARFAALTRKRAARSVRTGAVRTGGAALAPRNPNLWYVDVSASGTVCLYDFSVVRFWRPDSQGIATYTIAEAGSDATVDVTFDDKMGVAPLDPARMTLSEGTEYTITGPDGETVTSVTFVALPEEYERADQLAEALIDKQCNVQVDVMATRLGGPA